MTDIILNKEILSKLKEVNPRNSVPERIVVKIHRNENKHGPTYKWAAVDGNGLLFFYV